MTKQLIIDRLMHVPGSGGGLVKWQLTESADGKKITARGEFARADVATENKRMYPRSLWMREISSLQEALNERKVFGEVDHPNDGRTKLSRVSHLLTGLTLDGDVVVGEAEILDTDAGRNLKAILKGGGAVGVSSRGYGTTSPGPDGVEVVQDDYRLMTFDFVAEPANTTSYPNITAESRLAAAPRSTQQETNDMDITKLTAEELKKANPALFESIAAAAKAESASQLDALKSSMKSEMVQAVADLKGKAFEEAKAAIMSDPAIAGARIALDQVKNALGVVALPEDVQKVAAQKDEEIKTLKTQVSESNLRIKGLEEQLDRMCSVAKEAAYKLHLERRLKGEAKAEAIAKLIGDVRQYESVKAIDAKVEAVTNEIAKVVKVESVEKGKVAQLEAEKAKLQKSLEESLQVGRDVAVALYIERKTKGHPKAKDIAALIESKHPKTRAEVDSLYESAAGRFVRSDDEAERIRKRLGRAKESLLEEGKNGGKRPDTSAGQLLGDLPPEFGGKMQMEEILTLSGVRK